MSISVGVIMTLCSLAYFAHSIYYVQKEQNLIFKAVNYDAVVEELVSISKQFLWKINNLAEISDLSPNSYNNWLSCNNSGKNGVIHSRPTTSRFANNRLE